MRVRRLPATDVRHRFVHAGPVRPCEAKCPLFSRLGVLREVARNLEPMVGRRSEVLSRIVASLRRRPHESADVVRRNRNRVLALYEELFDD